LTVAVADPVEPDLRSSELIEVRRSDVHGLGVFATQRIPKGSRIIEYMGERVSHAEADRRYEEKDANDSHTFLFIVDSKAVIDAGVDGNDARFFNHSCDPNCESTVEKRRVYIESIRDIEPGEELTYDYQIQREDDDPENIDEVFACRCGFIRCRGTMLWPTERKPRRAAKKKARGKVASRAKTNTRAGAGSSARGGQSGRAGKSGRGGKSGSGQRRQASAKRRGTAAGRKSSRRTGKRGGRRG
jgi:uncharacterized protein